MSEFHDPELRRQLSRMSGPYPDDNEAFAAWQRRVGQARRRRAVTWSGGAALSLIMVTVGVAALQNPTKHPLVAGTSTEVGVDVSLSSPTTEAKESTIAVTAPDTTAAPTSAPDTEPNVAGTVATVETSVPETEATEVAGSGSGPGPNSGRSDGSAPPTSSSSPAASASKTFASVGGSVTVRQDGDQLTVIAIEPTAGFENDKDDRSDHQLDVSFKSDSHRSDISVKVSNGVMTGHPSEHDESHDGSAPVDSTGGDHGGSGKG